jgi:hypothetical protein
LLIYGNQSYSPKTQPIYAKPEKIKGTSTLENTKGNFLKTIYAGKGRHNLLQVFPSALPFATALTPIKSKTS